MKEEKTKKWWELVSTDIVQVSEQRANLEDGSQNRGIWIGKFTGIDKDGFPTGLVLDMYQCENDYSLLKKHRKAKKLYGRRFKLVRY